jgi:hypothetical protein
MIYDTMIIYDDMIYDLWYDDIIYGMIRWYDIYMLTLYMIWWYDDIWYDDWFLDLNTHILIRLYDIWWYNMMIYDIMIWYDDMVWYILLTAIRLPPGGGSTVHIYTQTIHRTTQTQTIHKTTQLIWEECGPCPVFASYTLAFVLQLRKKHGRTSVRVAEECQLARESRVCRTEYTEQRYDRNWIVSYNLQVMPFFTWRALQGSLVPLTYFGP